MLLGGESRLRLEPVAEVSDAVGHRPFLDDLGDGGGDVDVELFAEPDSRVELGEDFLGELVAHLARAEGEGAEVVGDRLPAFTRGGDVGVRDHARSDGLEGSGASVHEGGVWAGDWRGVLWKLQNMQN